MSDVTESARAGACPHPGPGPCSALPRGRAGVVLALLAALLAGACGGGPGQHERTGTAGPSTSRASGAPSGPASGSPSPAAGGTSTTGTPAGSWDVSGGSATGGAPAPSPADPADPAAGACGRRTLAGLTDAQRVGQVFVAGIPTTSDGAALAAARSAADSSVGNYLLFGGSDSGVAATKRLTGQVSELLSARAAGVPPFVATDQEGGRIQSLAGPGFDRVPAALTQGSWPVGTLRDAWHRYGTQLGAAGISLDFAPVADVVPASLGKANQPIGRYLREYGHTPDAVAAHAAAAVEGLQSAGVSATAKHFPGLGRVIGNTDTTAGVTDRTTTADDPALGPFRAAIDAGARVVMVSSARYLRIDPTVPAVFSPAVTALLRGPLGFRGLIASDDLGAAVQVADVAAGARASRFLAAGGQLVVVVRPVSVLPQMVAAVLGQVRSDPAARARVDAAAGAVLAAKESAGLLRCP